MKPTTKLYSLLSHYPTSCTTGFTPRRRSAIGDFLQVTRRAVDFDFAFMRTLLQVLAVAAVLLLDAGVRRRCRLHVRPAFRGGLCESAPIATSAAAPPLWCERTRRPALHAREHPRHVRAHAGARRDELGSTASLERASPHRYPTWMSGRRRPAGRTLTQSRTTTALAPAASLRAVVPAFGLFIRTLSLFQARRAVAAGG